MVGCLLEGSWLLLVLLVDLFLFVVVFFVGGDVVGGVVGVVGVGDVGGVGGVVVGEVVVVDQDETP